MHLPAALGDGLINGFVNLLIVVVLVSGVLPHVGFERGWMTAHVATQRTPEKKKRKGYVRKTRRDDEQEKSGSS